MGKFFAENLRLGGTVLRTVAVMTTLTASLLAQQQPPNVRGRMEGIVLRENTTEPISGAKVSVTRVNAATGAAVPTAGTLTTYLINPNPNAPLPPAPPQAGAPGAPPQAQQQPTPIPPVTTDRSGKFVIPDLEEGAYRIAVTLNGYVKQEYGQRGSSGQGTTLTLTRGEAMKDLVVRMTRAGNINGRIPDDSGLPASGVPLQLIKVSYNQAGIRTFQTAGTARTNDHGDYRLNWLTPGRYYLAAGTPQGPPSGSAPGGPPSPNESADTYVFTYYPGTTDLSRATSIEIKPGGDMVMDFLVPKAQLYKISGHVSGGRNAPSPSAVGISLAFQTLTGERIHTDESDLRPRHRKFRDAQHRVVLVPDRNRDRTDLYKAGVTDQTGRYTMKDIAPGDYKLFAWEALDSFAYFDQDMLKQSELRGKPVHVDETAKLKIDTKVIPEASR